jgi:mRNA interferase MazF
VKNYPFEVPLAVTGAITGVVLADHVKSLCWETRNVDFAGKATPDVIADIRAKIGALLEIP